MFIASVMAENGASLPKVKLPQVVKAKRPWLDPEQIKVFVKAVYGKPCEIPALLGLCSLRRSEIYALTWDKIDLSGNGTITVSGAVVLDEHHKLVRKSTNKNASSQRIVPILIPQLKNALEAARQEEGPLYHSGKDTLGEQVNAVCAKANLPPVGVHGLRHSFASLAYHLGLSQMETMRIGGWSEPSTVQNIYTHLSQKDKTDAAEKMRVFYQNC